jgi:hypothetical protein
LFDVTIGHAVAYKIDVHILYSVNYSLQCNISEYLKFDISEDPCPSYLKVEDFGEKGEPFILSLNEDKIFGC